MQPCSQHCGLGLWLITRTLRAAAAAAAALDELSADDVSESEGSDGLAPRMPEELSEGRVLAGKYGGG